MPSPSSYEIPLPTTDFSSIGKHSTYRQMEYHNGNAVRTIESRRPLRISSTESVQVAHNLAAKSREGHVKSPSRSQKTSQLSQAISTSSTQRQLHVHMHQNDHVIPKSPKSKAQVVILQGSVSVSVDFKGRGRTPHFNIDLSTPPPTPKLGRLATPELDDVDDRPFCDCCSDRQAMNYCAGCGCELYSGRC